MTYSQINLTKVRGFLFLIVLIVLVGCSTKVPIERFSEYQTLRFNHSQIPFCDELINKEGYNCIFTIDKNNEDYILDKSICKKYNYYKGEIIGLDFCSEVSDKIPKECMDLDNLNYTTLDISREDFEKLSCLRKVDWINGVCYPSECKERNPILLHNRVFFIFVAF